MTRFRKVYDLNATHQPPKEAAVPETTIRPEPPRLPDSMTGKSPSKEERAGASHEAPVGLALARLDASINGISELTAQRFDEQLQRLRSLEASHEEMDCAECLPASGLDHLEERVAELESRTRAVPKMEVDIEALGMWRDKTEERILATEVTRSKPLTKQRISWAALLKQATEMRGEEQEAYIEALATIAWATGQ